MVRILAHQTESSSKLQGRRWSMVRHYADHMTCIHHAGRRSQVRGAAITNTRKTRLDERLHRAANFGGGGVQRWHNTAEGLGRACCTRRAWCCNGHGTTQRVCVAQTRSDMATTQQLGCTNCRHEERAEEHRWQSRAHAVGARCWRR
jgi:hypothetical protein